MLVFSRHFVFSTVTLITDLAFTLHLGEHLLQLIYLFVWRLLSHVRLFETPWTAAHQGSLSITNSWSLLKLMSIESVIPSDHLMLCCPLLLMSSIIPSNRVFSSESVLWVRWPKYWSFSFSISYVFFFFLFQLCILLCVYYISTGCRIFSWGLSVETLKILQGSWL